MVAPSDRGPKPQTVKIINSVNHHNRQVQSVVTHFVGTRVGVVSGSENIFSVVFA